MKRIFLFDIDGTLMRRTGPHHAEALVRAIREVAGIDTTIDGIPVHGMLDVDILTEMMGRAGCATELIAGRMHDLVRRAQEVYPDSCPDLRACVLPGIRETLEEIASRGFPIGLVSGNLTQIGWTKVERAGLRKYFSFGAFADMGPTRAHLAKMAVAMAGLTGPAEATLIGDSPSDVAAAKANGYRMVSIATGLTSLDALTALRPDAVLPDLSDPANRRILIGD